MEMAMAQVRMDRVNLMYPLRHNKGISLKEFLLRRFRRERVQLIQQIHALRDLSFQIAEGERVGIIGLNGAGKSTLLRSIAGVYPIASGQRLVEGSICSLFDISLGFEMEATGYENIHYRLYLQGETPSSIKDKLAPIIEFAELGEFIKLPIRCYSTGMLMRLAFSIATSSAPEILVVDEVFSAGDIAFQQKAHERMRDFMNRAKIVIMVGHDLGFFEKFCTRVLWLEQGSLKVDGPPGQTIEAYRAAAAGGKRQAA